MRATANSPERDARTIALLIQGHRDGMRLLLEDHGGVVRAYLLRKFGTILDPWEIDEVLGLAAVRVWQSAARFDDSRGRLRAWFAVVARNNSLKLLAHKSGDPLVAIDCADAAVDMATSFSEAERMRLIVDAHLCLDRLEPVQRAVLLADLNSGEPMPAPILAERLGTTTQSVDAARFSGRRALRNLLLDLGHEPAVVVIPSDSGGLGTPGGGS
jgi:DNA-directed RNA polymerase specialized sigma24 family protein